MHWKLIKYNQAETERDLIFNKKGISLVEIQNCVSFPLRASPSSYVTGWLEFKQKFILFLLKVSEDRV